MTREERHRRKQEKRQRIRELQQLANGPLDVPFLILVLLLTVIGLLMLFSASFPSALYEKGDPLLYIRSQVTFALLGLGAMYLMSRINYDRLKGFSTIALIGSLALLVLVILPGPNKYGKLFGIRQNNATRWMRLFLIKGPQYQPSELAKLGVILYFATTIEQRRQKMRTFKYGILPYGIILLTFFILLWKEPHLSGAILICGIGAVMLVVGGIHPAWVGTGAAVAGLGAYAMLFTDLMEKIGYNSDRIHTWLDPWWDIRNKSFQMAQSLIAIGSGGLLGVGFGKSRQKFLYLPEEHNDFIFSVVCEELGLIGACLIILLFALLIMRGYWIAIHARDRFGSLLAVGVTTQIALQTFLNMAVVTGLIPATGISLPFFSYGGTALAVQLFEIGIVLSVSRQIPAPKAG